MKIFTLIKCTIHVDSANTELEEKPGGIPKYRRRKKGGRKDKGQKKGKEEKREAQSH